MVSFIPDNAVEELRLRADIVSIISEWVPLKKRGKNYVASCPFHVETTPSFTVSPEKQIFYCFGCGVGGNVYHFIMKVHGVSFPEAVQWLAERLGVSLPVWESRRKPHQRLYDLLEEAARFYEAALWTGSRDSEARRFLDTRGVGDEVARQFRIGYAPQSFCDLLNYLKKRGFSEEEGLQAGVIGRGSGGRLFDLFRNRVMFPIVDWRGRVIGFGGRVLGEGEPKYLNSPDTVAFQKGRNIYGLFQSIPSIQKTNRVILVEGYLDVVSLHQAGFHNAVAPLGTSVTKDQGRLLRRYASEVVIGFDGDTAGENAAVRAAELLKELGLGVKIIRLPDGLDPDSLIRYEGAGPFMELLDGASGLFEFKLQRALKIHNINTVEGKIKVIHEVRKEILNTDHPLRQEEYIKILAQCLNINEESIYRDIWSSRTGSEWDKRANSKHTKFEFDQQAIERLFEKQILKKIITDADTRLLIRQQFGNDIFTDPVYEQLAGVAFSLERRDLGPADMLSHLTDEAQAQALAEIMVEDELPELEPEALWLALRMNQLRKELLAKISEVKHSEQHGDSEGMKKLLREVVTIRRSLEGLRSTFRSKQYPVS